MLPQQRQVTRGWIDQGLEGTFTILGTKPQHRGRTERCEKSVTLNPTHRGHLIHLNGGGSLLSHYQVTKARMMKRPQLSTLATIGTKHQHHG